MAVAVVPLMIAVAAQAHDMGTGGQSPTTHTSRHAFLSDQSTLVVTGGFAGTGKTTAEMRTADTFLDAGWDFVGETANGTEDIWWIDDGKDYPRLCNELGRSL